MSSADVEALKRKALTGSLPAVHTLEELVARKELSLFDVHSTIILLLSLEHATNIHADDWISSPTTLIVTSCFGMLTIGLEEPRVTDHPEFSIAIFPGLWTLARKWCIRFIDRTGVLSEDDKNVRDVELLELVDRILVSILPHLTLFLKTSPHIHLPTQKFFRLITRLWFRCTSTPNLPTPTFAPRLADTILSKHTITYYHTVRLTTIEEISPQDVSKALVSSHLHIALTSSIHLPAARSLSMFTGIALTSMDHVNAIIAGGIAFYTARLLRQLASRRTQFLPDDSDQTHTIEITLRNIQQLLFLENKYEWAAGAMRGHIIHALLNTQVHLQSVERERTENYTMLAEVLDSVRPFLMWPTMQASLRQELTSIARTDIEKLIHPDSPLSKSFQGLKEDQAALRALRPYRCPSLSCNNCGCTLQKPKRCTGCKQSVYCSTSCQREHRKTHKYYQPECGVPPHRPPVREVKHLLVVDQGWIIDWTEFLLYNDEEFKATMESYEKHGDKDASFIVVDYRNFVEKRRPTVVIAPMDENWLVGTRGIQVLVKIVAPGFESGIPAYFKGHFGRDAKLGKCGAGKRGSRTPAGTSY